MNLVGRQHTGALPTDRRIVEIFSYYLIGRRISEVSVVLPFTWLQKAAYLSTTASGGGNVKIRICFGAMLLLFFFS